MKQTMFKLFSLAVIFALIFGFVPMQAQAAVPISSDIVISQVYGGAGCSTAGCSTYQNDYVEIFNKGTTTVSLAGLSLQYASATGSFNQVIAVLGTGAVTSLAPGQYYLVSGVFSSNGVNPIPTADAGGTTAMSATAGKIALVNGTTALACGATATTPVPCSSAQLAQIMDLVGYGTTTTMYEGSAPAPAPSTTTAVFRNSNGCTDTDQNSADFTAGAPAPRNSATTLSPCTVVVETAPSVSSTTPAHDDVDVGLTSNIVINFSEPVDVSGDWFEISCGLTLTHTAAVSGGPTSFTLDPDEDFAFNESCMVTVYAANVSDQDTDDPPDFMEANYTFGFMTLADQCQAPSTPIHSVQGGGAASPLIGQTVDVQGIVVGDFQNNASPDDGNLNGFHLQAEDSDHDDYPYTSEGVFIYYSGGTVDVATGDEVRVRGTVSEYNGLTEINASQVLVCDSGKTVTPTAVTLPVDSLTAFEAYEGMLVTFPQDLIISEYYNFDQFGEIVLTSERHMTPTAVYEPGSLEYANAVQAYLLDKITLDDGRTASYPDPAIHPNGAVFNMDNLFRGGDKLANVTGVMDYSFSLYRIQPTEGADYTSANSRQAEPEEVGGTLKVVSMNTLNYFTTLDLGPDICGPLADQECRGADTLDEFNRQHAKLVAAIVEMDPDVIGLIEVENNLTDEPMEILVEGLNDAVGAEVYAYVPTGAIGTDAIRAALIYKPATVSMLGDYAILDSSVDARFLDDFNRPVLAQTFKENQSGAVFTVAVNHLKSKGSACAGDPDLGDGAGNCNLTRLAAAQAEVDWLATDPTGSGDPDFLIIGDLNSYDKEDPIDAIKAGPDDVLGTADDYFDLVFEFQGEDAYSYVFDGQMGYLDFAISGPMVSQVTDTTVWHVNADEPDLIDYDMSYKKPAQDALYAPDAYRYSDHDPVIIGLDLVYFNPGGPVSVVENGTVALTVPPRKMDLNEGPLTYAWDLNGDGIFETPGRMVTFSAAGLAAPQSLVVKVKATNMWGYSTTSAVIVNVIYDFRGFLGQVDNQPVLNIAIAGKVIPVKFSLVGNKGLDIFAAGSPTVEKVFCPITATKNVVEKYVTLATPALSYNAAKDKYKFTWQTEAAWAGTCQLFTIELNDGTTHTALFKFK